MGDFIGKHIPYHSEGPGSQLVDGGIELFPPHIVHPHELISDKHYHVYVKYGYAQAYIKNSSDLEYWKTLYIKMQEDKGRIPNLNGFNQLIISMLRDGFNPAYPIPVDKNYDILDGSHRLAISLALKSLVYVHVFSKQSKNYEKSRLISFNSNDFNVIETQRQKLLEKKSKITDCSLMTIWGSSLNIWNELLPMIGWPLIKRSFIRQFSQNEYLAYIAVLYAGDGISNSSLTRKSWVLDKFGREAGILLLHINPEELQDLKIKIRKNFINKVQQYHFDSIVHTIDNLNVTPQILSLIEPYKPVGNMPIEKDILPGLTSFLKDNIHTTNEYRESLTNPQPSNNIINLVNKRIKLVIFDLDGVIADSELISAKAYQNLLKKRGVILPIENVCKLVCGISKKDVERLLLEKYSLQFTSTEQEEKQTWIRNEKMKMKSVLGIENFIKLIDCKKCIASGSSFEGIKRSLDFIGLNDFFHTEDLFSSQSVSHGKPSPELFLKIAQHYHVNPDEVMVIEDSIPGIIAANRAHMHYIWYGRGKHIPHTYTRDMLLPLTNSEYFRKIESTPFIQKTFQQILKSRTYTK